MFLQLGLPNFSRFTRLPKKNCNNLRAILFAAPFMCKRYKNSYEKCGFINLSSCRTINNREKGVVLRGRLVFVSFYQVACEHEVASSRLYSCNACHSSRTRCMVCRAGLASSHKRDARLGLARLLCTRVHCFTKRGAAAHCNRPTS